MSEGWDALPMYTRLVVLLLSICKWPWSDFRPHRARQKAVEEFLGEVSVGFDVLDGDVEHASEDR